MDSTQDSIFTKIIKGEVPCQKIYEDDKTFAFLDIHPAQPGHTLVVPKRQVEFLWNLPAEDYQAVMATAQKLALHIRTAMAKPYVGVKVIGIDVPHAHVHLIPFSSVAEYDNQPDKRQEPDFGALAAIAEKLAL